MGECVPASPYQPAERLGMPKYFPRVSGPRIFAQKADLSGFPIGPTRLFGEGISDSLDATVLAG